MQTVPLYYLPTQDSVFSFVVCKPRTSGYRRSFRSEFFMFWQYMANKLWHLNFNRRSLTIVIFYFIFFHKKLSNVKEIVLMIFKVLIYGIFGPTEIFRSKDRK